MNSQKGFTLIELVIVIILVGILAAFLMPRYANFQTASRISSLNALAGTLQASVATVKAGFYANAKVSPVTLDNGATVAVTTTAASLALGAPLATAAGIANAIDYSGFNVTYAATEATFDFIPAVLNCNVTYSNPNTSAAVVINTVTSGC
jgi:MSHA pilin protein MshA